MTFPLIISENLMQLVVQDIHFSKFSLHFLSPSTLSLTMDWSQMQKLNNDHCWGLKWLLIFFHFLPFSCTAIIRGKELFCYFQDAVLPLLKLTYGQNDPMIMYILNWNVSCFLHTLCVYCWPMDRTFFKR